MTVPDQPVILVHSLSGRMRIRIPDIAHDDGLAGAFCDFLLAQSGVMGVRCNRWCASVVINYDPAVISPPAITGAAERAMVSGVLGCQPAPKEAPATLRQRLLGGIPARLQVIFGAASFAAGLLGASPLVTYGLLAPAGAAIAGRALRTLIRERRASIDALDATAGALMIMRGSIVSAGFMAALIGLGEYIRERTARRSRALMVDLLGTSGLGAWVVRGGRKVRVPADQVYVGEVVVTYPGERVPVDGHVLEGHAMLDQRSLTGEADPVEKQRGDAVFAATVLVEGKLYLRVEAVGVDTRAGKVVEVVRSMPLGETRIENYASAMADRLVLPIFGSALLSYALSRDLTRAISLLVIDFGTGIRIAAPTGVLAAMAHAAHRGILIKSGASIERLAKVDAVVFDKTGTLTRGEPEVTEVISLLPTVRSQEVLTLAAAAELRLRHPAAHAIVRRARQEACEVPDRNGSEYMLGLGVRTEVDGQPVHVGSRLFLEREGIDTEAGADWTQRTAERAESVVYVARDRVLIGLIAYADPLRAESMEVVAALRAFGVKDIVMLTGDNEAAALAAAEQVGIGEYQAAVFPEQKAEVVKRLRRSGRTVAVVGDGINDSPALVHADVAISLHHGTDVAQEAADVILTDDDLRRFPEAIQIARDAMALLRENLAIVAVPNAVGLLLAAFGRIGPAGATLANNGSTVLAALNSLRPLFADRIEQGGVLDAPDEDVIVLEEGDADDLTLPAGSALGLA